MSRRDLGWASSGADSPAVSRRDGRVPPDRAAARCRATSPYDCTRTGPHRLSCKPPSDVRGSPPSPHFLGP
eukprot:514597-Prorocentrum_minimum.AAC.4